MARQRSQFCIVRGAKYRESLLCNGRTFAIDWHQYQRIWQHQHQQHSRIRLALNAPGEQHAQGRPRGATELPERAHRCIATRHLAEPRRQQRSAAACSARLQWPSARRPSRQSQVRVRSGPTSEHRAAVERGALHARRRRRDARARRGGGPAAAVAAEPQSLRRGHTSRGPRGDLPRAFIRSGRQMCRWLDNTRKTLCGNQPVRGRPGSVEQ